MSIRFRCKGCNQKYELEDDWSGETVDCVKCETAMQVPEKSEIPDSADVAAVEHHKNIEKATPIASFIPNVDKSKIQRIKVSSTNSKNQSPDDIIFKCKICSQKYRLPKQFGGHLAECSKCKRNMIVPNSQDIAVTEVKSEEKVTFWCKYCGQKYRLPKNIAGQEGECTKCNKVFKIPEQSELMPPAITSEPKSSDSEVQKKIPEKIIAPDSFKVIQPGGIAKTSVPSPGQKVAGGAIGQPPPVLTVPPNKTEPKPIEAVKYPERDSEKTQTSIAMTKTARNMVKYVLEIPQRNIFFAAFALIIDWLMQFKLLHKIPRKLVIGLFFFAVIITGIVTYSSFKIYQRNTENMLKVNVMCTACKFCEARAVKNIFSEKCSKCKGQVGFAWKCTNCNGIFTRIEKQDEDAPIDYGKLDKLKPPTCPFCSSNDVKYDAPPKNIVISLKSSPRGR